MKKQILILLCTNFLLVGWAQSQDIRYAQSMVNELCSPKFSGRGYVNDGVNKAAQFLEKEFKRLKLKPIQRSYTQNYAFPVNTHSGDISCSIDGQQKNLGEDYIVNCGAASIEGDFILRAFNWKDSADRELFNLKLAKGFLPNEALVIRYANERSSHIFDTLLNQSAKPKLIVFTEEKKITHSIATELDPIPSITIFDSLIFNKENIHVKIQNKFIERFECKNVMGIIKGKNQDSTVVFSAHYDHLGMQGDALFPGASDNASGVSMILSLAKYYAKHKPNYNTVFILFSGEEAGLIGSNYFTEYPTINLKEIKFVINIDIMGNAENGITVVNGETHKKEFESLSQINQSNKYIPEVRIRGKAANSDHHFFAEKGVPAVFIYSMGGQGYYHDVFDTPQNLKYTNFTNVFQLIVDFADRL